MIVTFPRRPDYYAMIARLAADRDWDTWTVLSLFEGLDVPPGFRVRLAAAIAREERARGRLPLS